MTGNTILVVDEDDPERHSIACDLETHGYRVFEAQNAKAALDILDTIDFDIVLTDLQMRGGSGLEIAEALHQTGRRPRVVVMTSRPSTDLVSWSKRRGIGLLSRPFSLIDFQRMVADLTAD